MKPKQKAQPVRWPFDPLQPGDQQPVQIPEEAQRVQKQTGAGGRNRSPKGGRR